ncbi:hypothetical protein ABN763_06740 [Spongiivirga sp. MCCC 1A20706]|uniref:hypothetical protein n=1 Tax=Spongiivirga sp. MCCC 1A20706 TaxID=3160963 RepID=UPI003977B971
MKKLMNNMLLSTLLLGLIGCNKDDGTDVLPIRLQYSDNPSTTYRTAGTLTPIIIDWNGEAGSFEVTTESEILRRDVMTFDSITGVFSWQNELPLGAWDFTVTARNSMTSASVMFTFKNEFVEGVFTGGFIENLEVDTTDQGNFPPAYTISLNEDKTITMTKFDDPTFSAVGEWRHRQGGSFNVEFITALSAPNIIYLDGFIYAGNPRFSGKYGNGINEDGTIKDPSGTFSFF